jgi:hypothetical protein
MESNDVLIMESDDAFIEHLCKPAEWTQSIPFMMIPEEEMGKDNGPELELLDIMSISDITYKGPYRYYFPCKYKPSDPHGHQLLTNDIRGAGVSQGVTFARQGGGPKKGVGVKECPPVLHLHHYDCLRPLHRIPLDSEDPPPRAHCVHHC